MINQAAKHFYLWVSVCMLSVLLRATPVNAQQDATQLHRHLEAAIQSGKYDAAQRSDLQQFYASVKNEPVWLNPQHRLSLESLFRLIGCADYEGLDPEAYEIKTFTDFLTHAHNLVTVEDSLELELSFTLSAIRFFRDLKYGNKEPQLAYSGLAVPPRDASLPSIVASHATAHSLHALPGKMIASFPQVSILTQKLAQLIDRVQGHAGWDPEINSKEISWQNIPLVTKLYNLGIINNTNGATNDSDLVRSIRFAQRMFNLTADGKPGKETLQQLNVPIRFRIKQLSLSINYYKWLAHMGAMQTVILVNIPAARLNVYSGDSTLLSMRMVVGKPTTPTPTLSSTVDKIILYPYWTVPYSIATKELLPIFKRDPAYVQNGNYQVLDNKGRLINSRSIRWSDYSVAHFPFTIRQSTGCDNALGLLKLDFENPFGVYLHDTPLKLLFSSNNRFMSHGCMRMEKPIEMGRMLLGTDTRAIDTLTQKGCLRNQSPITVPAAIRMPVVVWYNPVWADKTGSVVFYADVYHKLSWLNESTQ